MDIDLAALRALERERDISLEILIPAIEQALLVAYHRTDGAYRHARVELDRKSGHVVVWAREERLSRSAFAHHWGHERFETPAPGIAAQDTLRGWCVATARPPDMTAP